MIGEGPVGSCFEARIWFQGEGAKALNEYREKSLLDQQYKIQMTTAFAECEDSKTFEIRVETSQASWLVNQALIAHVYINGKKLKSAFLKSVPGTTIIAGCETLEAGLWVVKQLKFEEQKTTDDASKVRKDLDYSKLGKIRLEIWKCRILGPSTSQHRGAQPIPQNETVLEARGKVSSCVILDTQSKPWNCHFQSWVAIGTGPVQIFEWMYCNEAKLVAHKIIDPPSSNSISKPKRRQPRASSSKSTYVDTSDSGEEDDKELEERLFREYKAFKEFKEFKKWKRAREASDSSELPKKKAKPNTTVVITLSDDED